MGTLGKALGSSGGFITGSRALIEFLINRARAFIFSTAPAPASAAAACAAVRLISSAEGRARHAQLWALIDQAKSSLNHAGWPVNHIHSAIIPLIIGDETHAMKAAAQLREAGILIPAIRYPTVARGRARLRLTLSASHTSDDLSKLFKALTPIIRNPKSTIHNP